MRRLVMGLKGRKLLISLVKDGVGARPMATEAIPSNAFVEGRFILGTGPVAHGGPVGGVEAVGHSGRNIELVVWAECVDYVLPVGGAIGAEVQEHIKGGAAQAEDYLCLPFVIVHTSEDLRV